MDTMRKIICSLFMLAALCAQAVASGSSPFLPSAQLVGQGQFTRFGFSVYEARFRRVVGEVVAEMTACGAYGDGRWHRFSGTVGCFG